MQEKGRRRALLQDPTAGWPEALFEPSIGRSSAPGEEEGKGQDALFGDFLLHC